MKQIFMMVLLPFFFAVGMRAQTQQTGVVNNGDYVYDYDDNMKYRITEVSDDDPYKVYVALDGFIDAGDTRKDLNIKSSFISASGDNVYHYIVSTIGEGAFRGNTTIECVHVHIGCMVIGVSAFQNCTALKKAQEVLRVPLVIMPMPAARHFLLMRCRETRSV